MRRTMLEEHERATQSGHEETTVGVFREIWLADCADRLAPRTVHSYQRILQLEALTPLLPMELHEVTARKLAPIISRVTAEHGRPSGLAAFRTLSAMFGLAERWGYIELNPFRRMQAPSVPKREPTVPTPIVMERAMRVATPEFASLLQFAICTGCRRGEIAGLRWSDIDTEKSSVTVRRSIDSTPGNGLPKETKTASTKVISLDEGTLAALDAHKARQADQGRNNAWVWSRDRDGVIPIRPDRISDLWADVRAQLPELEGVRFHDIRHATATWLIAAGMDPRTVADRLGHDDVKLTLSTYTAPVAASDRRAATIIGDLLAGARAGLSADVDDGERSGS